MFNDMNCTSHNLSLREYNKASGPKLKTPGGIFYSVYLWMLHDSFLLREPFLSEGKEGLPTFQS